jgi:hypothetical protein
VHVGLAIACQSTFTENKLQMLATTSDAQAVYTGELRIAVEVQTLFGFPIGRVARALHISLG